MPKRPRSEEDDVVQPIKKQQNSKTRYRKIQSSSSERALQLLYEGAIRFETITENKNEQVKVTCSGCVKPIATVICGYCERDICSDCKNFCYKCSTDFCTGCSFLTYDQNEAVCYSCCTY